ncbi:MAG: hypothetical protein M3332_16550 [Actinomycetota bacterium]|nr:hypothetical protein [Actinomycetota bacterium]
MVRSAPPLQPADRSADEYATDSCVLAASWCRSVGATWTVELRSVHPRALTGPVVEWICSGVPTRLPIPERQTVDLLGEHGLLLFPDDPVDAVESVPQARSRRLIGYVTRDPEVIALALHLADAADEEVGHPMVLAARWIQAGYSADTAASWVAAGVNWPEVATTVLST